MYEIGAQSLKKIINISFSVTGITDLEGTAYLPDSSLDYQTPSKVLPY